MPDKSCPVCKTMLLDGAGLCSKCLLDPVLDSPSGDRTDRSLDREHLAGLFAGKLEIREQLGANMAAVYRAYDIALDREVVLKALAHIRFWVDGSRSAAIKDSKRAFPRCRRLCVNSKKARYSGRLSCEMPRWGRSQLRNNDQTPSIVLTCTSWKPSPSSSRAYSP